MRVIGNIPNYPPPPVPNYPQATVSIKMVATFDNLFNVFNGTWHLKKDNPYNKPTKYRFIALRSMTFTSVERDTKIITKNMKKMFGLP